LDDLHERPVGDPLAVGEATAEEHGRLALDVVGELSGEARLADARGRQDGAEARHAAVPCLLVHLDQTFQLRPAADERGLEAAGESRRLRIDAHQPPGWHAVCLALEIEIVHRLQLDGVAHELAGRVPEEDLTGAGGLLESRGDVDGITGGVEMLRARVAHDDLAGVHARPQGNAYATLLLELHVQRFELVAELRCRAHRAHGVVLVHRRNPEDSHDGVADELLHRAAVPFEHGLGRLEVASHDPAEGLGIELLAKARRPRDIGEDDGDGLPRLARHVASLRREKRASSGCARAPAPRAAAGRASGASPTPPAGAPPRRA
jgi:hypothetical protein